MKLFIGILLAGMLAAPGATVAAARRGAAQAAPVIHMRNFAFTPKTLTVAAGTSVTIVNDDNEAHTASAVDKSFDSEGLDQHDSWKHVFAKPGSYPYFCELHPYMKGVIIVLPAKSKGTS